MLKHIMVPLDGSKFAEQALPLALILARRAHARLHLVAVRPAYPLEFAGTGTEEYLEHVRAQIESELPGAITHTVLVNEQSGLGYPPPPSTGAADVLARHAAGERIDLILMTTHGRGGLRRAWLGSVADSLLRLSTVPVLLLKPHDEEFTIAAEADRGLQHVVVPLDGSARAEQAIPLALELGRLFDARYTLLRVMMSLAYTPHHDALPDYLPELASPMSRQAVEQYLEELAAPLRRDGLEVATYVAQQSSAAGAIADFAQEHGASLIAMSTSGAGGMRRLLLGSIADKVVRGAEVPVLVMNVHALEDAQDHESGTEAAHSA